MRKILLLTACFILVLAATARAAELKIGIIDLQKVVRTSDSGKSALDKLKDQTKEMKDNLDKQKAQIDKMRADMEKQSLVLSQEAKMDKEMQLKRQLRDLQDNFQNFQRKMKVEEERLSKPVLELIGQVVQDYGKKNGFSLLMDGRGAGVLFANDAVDVTNEVLVEVNKAFRTKGGK